MLLAAETFTLFDGIGVAGGVVSVLYSLGVAFVTFWLFAEGSSGDEGKIFGLGFTLWAFGVAGILFVTTAIQGLVAG